MSLREELQAQLLEWAFDSRNDGWTDRATRLFFRPDLGPVLKLPWFRDLFPDWLVHDYVDPEGRTLARRYLREHFLELEPVETRILKSWSPGELRILEVSRVRRGRGVVCRDLYRDGQVELRDGTLAVRSSTGDVLLARVIRDPDCTRVAPTR